MFHENILFLVVEVNFPQVCTVNTTCFTSNGQIVSSQILKITSTRFDKTT